MGQVKKQSRCVRIAIFLLKVLDDSLSSWMMKMHIFKKKSSLPYHGIFN